MLLILVKENAEIAVWDWTVQYIFGAEAKHKYGQSTQEA